MAIEPNETSAVHFSNFRLYVKSLKAWMTAQHSTADHRPECVSSMMNKRTKYENKQVIYMHHEESTDECAE